MDISLAMKNQILFEHRKK